MIVMLRKPVVTLEAILPLYEAVGWTNYTQNPAMLKEAYEKFSSYISSAMKKKNSLVYCADLEMGPQFVYSRYF